VLAGGRSCQFTTQNPYPSFIILLTTRQSLALKFRPLSALRRGQASALRAHTATARTSSSCTATYSRQTLPVHRRARTDIAILLHIPLLTIGSLACNASMSFAVQRTVGVRIPLALLLHVADGPFLPLTTRTVGLARLIFRFLPTNLQPRIFCITCSKLPSLQQQSSLQLILARVIRNVHRTRLTIL
jgi:hypothetical protein